MDATARKASPGSRFQEAERDTKERIPEESQRIAYSLVHRSPETVARISQHR